LTGTLQGVQEVEPMSTRSTADAPLDSPARMTFDGESTALHHTRVAGTLDTELRRGTNVLVNALVGLTPR
jgi:hypothetical protein